MRRHTWILWAILAIALAFRLLLALTSVYLWDEDREWIRLAATISFDPRSPHLPLQGYTHPVLPAYFMHLGSVLLGENPLGFRLLSLVAGVLTVLVGYRIASRVAGTRAGALTAAVLAFNEYHVMVSSVAVDMVFYLLFSLLAIGAFLRFLEQPRPWPLVQTALATGAGYLCNERAGLLVPIWGVALLVTGNGRWMKRWPTWAALATFLLVISPDLAKGLRQGPAGTQASHADQLSRIAGVGLTAQPLAFYGKGAVRGLLSTVGVGFKDWAPEYPAMNVVLGLALLGAAGVVAFTKTLREDAAARTCLAVLALVLVVLVFVDTKASEEANLAPQAWYWADLTLLPAALLAGIAAGRLGGWPARLITIALVAGCLLASYRIVIDRLGTYPVKAGALPGVLAPADGRMVEVRTGFQSCVLCDPSPTIALEKVEVREGDLWRAPRPDEVEVDEAAGRRLHLRASKAGLLYALHYGVRARDGSETPVSIDVVVKDEPSRYPPMFWLEPQTVHLHP